MGDPLSFTRIIRPSAGKTLAVFSLVASISLLTACQSGNNTVPTETPAVSSSAQSTPVAAPKSETAVPTSTPVPEIPELKLHSVAGGTLSFSTPDTWSLKRLDLLEGQRSGPTAENLLVVDATGKTMAEFSTSFAPVLDNFFDPEAPVFPYQVIEQQKSSVKHILSEGYKDNRFAFEALGSGADIQGLLAIGLEPYEAANERQGLYSSAVNVDDGLYFAHPIEPTTVLSGVDKALTGHAKFKAYQQTDEYKAIKAMMLSLKQTGKAAAPAAQRDPENEACIGKMYSYDLAGSTISCTQAKTFVQKIQDEGGGGAGRFDLVGFGGCFTIEPTGQEDFNDSLVCQSTDKKTEFKIRFRG